MTEHEAAEQPQPESDTAAGAAPQAGEAVPLEQRVEEERAKAERYLANWQRAQADFINYKRRTEQERCDLTVVANAESTRKLLPVVDDLERAFRMLPAEAEEFAWAEGFRLIYKKMKDLLASQGLQEIETVGKPFDPRVHEAVGYEEGGENGIIIREEQKGYRFCDRVLRPSLVVVGKGKS